MTIQLQKVQYPYDNTTAKPTIQMAIQLQKVQYTYDNTTAKSKKPRMTIQKVWQYNCKKYNTMAIQKVYV